MRVLTTMVDSCGFTPRLEGKTLAKRKSILRRACFKAVCGHLVLSNSIFLGLPQFGTVLGHVFEEVDEDLGRIWAGLGKFLQAQNGWERDWLEIVAKSLVDRYRSL